MVDLACDMRSYDYFYSDDPVEAAKFVVFGCRRRAVGVGAPS